MGNEQSAEEPPQPPQPPQPLPAAERAALRRLESAHLSEEPAAPGPPPGAPPPRTKIGAAPTTTTTTIVNTKLSMAEGNAAAKPAKPAAPAKSKPPPPNNKTVHVADAAEGDRRKFYHASVETTSVGDDDDVDTAAAAAAKEDKFAVFVRWMKEHGARFPDQHLVKYTEECRGVHAKKNIPADEQIAYIPLKLLIHEGHGQETDVGAKVWNSPNNNVIVPAHTQVIIFMMLSGAREAARGEECTSFYAPYFRILPENFDCFPIFWTEEELSWLSGSDLVRQIRDRRRNIVADYHEVSRICPSFGERFTEDDFLWCRTAVGSRNFGININGIKRTTMVPWADMLNHFRPRETSWTFSNEQQGFTMTSLKPLVSGQQIMDSYGKKCNSKFLMHYGFAIEKNREEDGKCMNEMPLVLVLEVGSAAVGLIVYLGVFCSVLFLVFLRFFFSYWFFWVFF
jgi:hypothetical protein